MIVAIIPARGGSKSIPNKNIKSFNGKPLITWSIAQAKNTKEISKIFVSSDSDEILNISQEAGADIIKRPESISTDTASSESALLHSIAIIEKRLEIEYFVFLQCTSPFRKGDDISNAINQIRREGADSLLSVHQFHGFLWKKENEKSFSINYNFQNRPRRQDREVEYLENGSIYIFKPDVLKTYKNRLGGKISIYVMEQNCVDIDTMEDFKLAEILMRENK